jgi:hypothetical protein
MMGDVDVLLTKVKISLLLRTRRWLPERRYLKADSAFALPTQLQGQKISPSE